ncbi:MAG TPA: polymer-forming cytoskeletal protein [Methanosarcinales archaeon]|nr:polymer-forming cytoskeletal protein [Methanosarcinales archaeon]
METDFISRHKDSDTFIIRRSSFFDAPVHLKGNLIVGTSCNFWSDLATTGALKLGKGVAVKGSVRAESVIIGAHSVIEGDVKTEQDCTVLDGARIGGDIVAGGKIMLRPNIKAGIVDAMGNIEITGKSYVTELRAGAKIIATKHS